jgi:ribose/xylose/arabinose/galactoside ABC-type transport system permease subunit
MDVMDRWENLITESHEQETRRPIHAAARQGETQMKRQAMVVVRPLIGLVLITGAIALFAPTFRSVAALSNVLENASVLFIMCTGMTVALIGGCLDLSVGSTYALASVVLGQLLMAHVAVPLAILGALASGVLCGVINGGIVSGTGIPPLIATLGTQLAFRGVANMIGAASNMSAFPASFDMLGSGFWGPMINCLIAFGVVWFFLGRTKMGFQSFAIGGNEEVARLAGIPVKRNKIIYYAMSGIMAALAGVVYTARVDMAQVNRGQGMELWAIAGVVIGGTSAFGGVGSVVTTVIGVLIISVLQAGMIHLRVEAFLQQVVVGVVIILAVWLDFWQRRRAASG